MADLGKMARKWEGRNDHNVNLTQVVDRLLMKISAMIKYPRQEWVNRIPILLGDAGIGKTTVLKLLSDKLVTKTKLPWRSMTIHAATQGMEDNTGLPILKKVGGRDVAGWAAPEHIPGAVPWMDDKGESKGWTLGIIDELPTAPLLIQDQIRQLIDGFLPGSSVPVDPQCVYVAAGNPPDPRYVTVNAMDEALEKRLKVYVVIPTPEELLQVWSRIMPQLIYKFLFMNKAAIKALSPREWHGVSNDVQYVLDAGGTHADAIGEAEDELADNVDVIAVLRKFVEFGDNPYYYPISGVEILQGKSADVTSFVRLMQRWVTDGKDGLLGATSNDLLRALKTTPAAELVSNKQAGTNVIKVVDFLAGAERPDMVKALMETVFETPLVDVVASEMRQSPHLAKLDDAINKAKVFRKQLDAAPSS